MLRVVFDTNIVVSDSLWSGAPNRALQAAQDGRVQAFVSEAMLDELLEVISRPKFAKRLTFLQKTTTTVLTDYLQYVEVVTVTHIEPVVLADHDDDWILACAISAGANCIVSGDPHVLNLGKVQDAAIISVGDFLKWIESETK